MRCELEKDDVKTFPGLTLFPKPGSTCIKPTGVYLPPKHSDTKKELDVVLWLHGWYVTDAKHLFHRDKAQVRQQVQSSSKDVVLVAPFLGKKMGKDDPHANYDVSDLNTAKWGERYLSEVLAALARFQNKANPPDLNIKSLTIACHSGGGEGMRYLVGTLGKFQSKLKECWGFDCLYRQKTVDDATFWYNWMSGKDARPLYIRFGPGTLPQSVKLDLTGRGKATPKGDKADPPGPKITDLHVTFGNYDAAINDQVIAPPQPPPKSKPTKPMNFVEQAAANFSGNVIWMEEKDLHYFIATDGFLSRLRKAGFFV
jgi:hypothetical protein